MFLVLVLISVFAIYKLLTWALSQIRVGDYTNKHVLITGCDSGFGNLLARRLDVLGFNVFAACLTTKGAEDLQGACSQRVTTLIVDVTNGKSIAEARQFVEARLPAGRGLWGLVNNAGIMGTLAPIEWMTREDWKRCLDVNFFGMVDVTRAFLPLVRLSHGRVVNMSSMFGRIAIGPSAYSISKYCIEAYSDFLRRQLRSHGANVYIVEPGGFKTGIADVTSSVKNFKNCLKNTPAEVRSCYPRCNETSFLEVAQKMQNLGSEKLHLVIDAYELALTSKYPPARQLVGNDARCVFRLLWNLPTPLTDWILDKILHRF